MVSPPHSRQTIPSIARLLLWAAALALLPSASFPALDLLPVHEILIDRVDVAPGQPVEVTFRALDAQGQPVHDLRHVDVALTQDGEPVEAVSLTTMADPGTAVVLAIDQSRTMMGRPLEHVRSAARAFVEALGPRDRVALLLIGSEARLAVDFEDSRGRLLAELQMLEAEARSTRPALWDGVAHALDVLRSETRPGMVVLFSDGRDQASEASPESLREAAAGPGRAPIPIHPVAYRGRGDAGLPALTLLAEASGTRVQALDRTTSLEPSLLVPRRTAYRLRYAAELDGAPHRVAITSEGVRGGFDMRFPLVVRPAEIAQTRDARVPLAGLVMVASSGLALLSFRLRRRTPRAEGRLSISMNRWSRSYHAGSQPSSSGNPAG